MRINPMLNEMRGTVKQTSDRDYLVRTEQRDFENQGMPFEQSERKYKGRKL